MSGTITQTIQPITIEGDGPILYGDYKVANINEAEFGRKKN